jgi:Raf kinase inhibitor-like YbhB/YbcL family protein
VGARRALVVALAVAAAGCGGGEKPKSELPAAPDNLKFSTPDFKPGAAIPAKFTCDGGGKPPTLVWREVPQGAVELVLVVEDQDADVTFTHWTAYGIPAFTLAGLAPNGQFPAGTKNGKNSAGKDGWTPPCPPGGDDPHHYTFALYALKQATGLENGATPEQVMAKLKGAMGRGSFTGTYARK